MTQMITADTKMTLLKAIFSAEYRVDIAFFDRGGRSSTQECAVKARTLGPKPIEAGSGVVFVNGIAWRHRIYLGERRRAHAAISPI